MSEANAVLGKAPLPPELEVAAMPRRSRLAMGFRALAHRNFQLFMSGQLISLIGTWMQNISQAWLVYQLTGSSLLLGVVGFSSQFPILLLGPVGGIVADRWNRHRVVIGTQAASMVLAFMLAGLTLTGKIKVWEIVTLSALLGCVNAFDIPARQTFLMDMVGREDLVSAIGLNSSMFNSARIIGPAIAGLLVAYIGEGWCFFANAVSYIAVIAGLLMMKLGPVVREETSASHLERVVEGFRFVRNTGPIFAPLLLLAVVSLVALPFSVLMPIFADRILHGGARGLGILMGATGVGAVLGALTVATRHGVRGLARVVVLAAAGFGTALILFSASRWFWVSAALLVPVGYFMMLQMTCTNTLIQTLSPDRLRGRVMSVYSMMVMGMMPFGSFFAGAIAEHLGASLTVAAGALGCLAATAWFARHLPKLRQQAREQLATGQIVGDVP
jgi:MFS family permease